jgi:hypothetical protein
MYGAGFVCGVENHKWERVTDGVDADGCIRVGARWTKRKHEYLCHERRVIGRYDLADDGEWAVVHRSQSKSAAGKREPEQHVHLQHSIRAIKCRPSHGPADNLKQRIDERPGGDWSERHGDSCDDCVNSDLTELHKQLDHGGDD